MHPLVFVQHEYSSPLILKWPSHVLPPPQVSMSYLPTTPSHFLPSPRKLVTLQPQQGFPSVSAWSRASTRSLASFDSWPWDCLARVGFSRSKLCWAGRTAATSKVRKKVTKYFKLAMEIRIEAQRQQRVH